MKKILDLVLPFIVEAVLKLLTPTQIESAADKFLDWVESAVISTKNDYDNEIVIPLIRLVRETFNIKDND